MIQRRAGRPSTAPTAPYAPGDVPLHIEGDWIWAPLKGEWRVKTPEELVRQKFIYRLHTYYGYGLNQMDQERRITHGRSSARADIVVCKDADALRDNRDYVITVECKSDNVTIVPDDYQQGESYARSVGCEFLVTHNNKETRSFRLVPGAPGDRIDIENVPKASDIGDAKRLEAIRRATKAFTRNEFRQLLEECHNILRDNHKLDPGRAFDEISKILFIKMWLERTGEYDRFTTEYLDEYARIRRKKRVDDVMHDLFDDTKDYYRADDLFGVGDKLNISFATFRRIVKKLERFNLSSTSDDVKGIAFESFLGQTFRGELGQFFTPRPIVDFMVEMLDPQEGEVICDPASGSGGFLIKCFEYLRAAIEADIQRQKAAARAAITREAESEGWDEEEQSSRLNAAFEALNQQLEMQVPGSRLSRVAHDCIFGVDAESRAARTSKMNMIMHGDGHGGIHHHDGLVDVNGIFPRRFDIVLTNPPFGSTVGADQRVGATDETRVTTDREQIRRYEERFGEPYKASHSRMVAAMRNSEPVLKLYDIGREPVGAEPSRAKVRNSLLTEMLFLERCIDLLKPGGRMGIVLPEGILNNPSHQWLRSYSDGRARILAVISLPQEVFASSKATVKTSLVFLRRFTAEDERAWDDAQRAARAELGSAFDARRQALRDEFEPRIARYDRDDIQEQIDTVLRLERSSPLDKKALASSRRALRDMIKSEDRSRQKDLRRALEAAIREVDGAETRELRARVKELFDYPIFMAEAESAGITGTGDTGPGVPNELPVIAAAFREFLADPDAFEARVLADEQLQEGAG